MGKANHSTYLKNYLKAKRMESNERLRTDRKYNLDICSIADCDGKYGMPIIHSSNSVPNRLIPFNYAMTAEDRDCWIHFFIDDYQFERLWNDPWKYLDLLRGFNGVLSPDFSLYADMPLPMQMFNEYRRRALMRFWQQNGIDVIPTLSWSNEDSYGFCFEGLLGGTVAVSTVGTMRDEAARGAWKKGIQKALEAINPETVLIYGQSPEIDLSCKVVEYQANTLRGVRYGR